MQQHSSPRASASTASDPSATAPLIDGVLGLVCDLDGVVFHGRQPVPGAPEALAALGQRVPVLYATNNASRRPTQVAAHLHSMGIRARDVDVLTSATVGAARVAELVPAGSRVLAVGGDGVREALRELGLVPVTSLDPSDPVSAVLQGYAPTVSAADLAQAARAVQEGAVWVATNTDLTLPTEWGAAPGNGSLVQAVAHASGTQPEVVGKPGPAMYARAAELVGANAGQMLGVGDRLETDISGARAAGMRSALVLTGVHGPVEAASASHDQRPELIIEDVASLLLPYAAPRERSDGAWQCGSSTARLDDDHLQVSDGSVEAVRAAIALLWSRIDAGDCQPGSAAELIRSSVVHRSAASS